MNVLILEDNQRCREALEGIVESCQNVSRVFCFARREEALICAADYKIDLFLIDIILETGKDNDNSGIRFADSLRECASYKLTPIIFIQTRGIVTRHPKISKTTITRVSISLMW